MSRSFLTPLAQHSRTDLYLPLRRVFRPPGGELVIRHAQVTRELRRLGSQLEMYNKAFKCGKYMRNMDLWRAVLLQKMPCFPVLGPFSGEARTDIGFCVSAR
jgi:hypothetical protein